MFDAFIKGLVKVFFIGLGSGILVFFVTFGMYLAFTLAGKLRDWLD